MRNQACLWHFIVKNTKENVQDSKKKQKATSSNTLLHSYGTSTGNMNMVPPSKHT